jgi:hypothetical protein
VGCAARSLSRAWRNDHGQFAKYPIPSIESSGTICSLQNFLQDWRREPDRPSMIESSSKQFDFDQIVAA